jgi:hypothetical protein
MKLSNIGIFMLSVALLLVCSSGRYIASTQVAPATQLYGHWVYASGASGGRSTSVSGDLKISSDGKFDDSRRIGGIGGFRRGTFTVKGDQLTLKFDDGKNSQTYTISFGTQKDKTGKEFKTLILKGNDLSFLLTKKEG